MEYPKLRPVEALPTRNNLVCLRDPQGFSDKLLLIPPVLFFVVSLFDGKHSLPDIQNAYAARIGEPLPAEKVGEIVEQLDQALFLDSERFRQVRAQTIETFRSAPLRVPTHAGLSYEAEPEPLRRQLRELLEEAEGAEPADTGQASGRLRALIAPHIDLRRGGLCFASSYAELARESRARTFVILGISHVPTRHPFVLTAKDFQTPMGRIATNRAFLEKLGSHCRTDFYEDEFCHRSEHSVEFQTLFLHYLYGESVSIVPILCSIPPEMYLSGTVSAQSEIEEFVGALARSLEQMDSEVCCIAAVDLSHVGRRFGQDVELTPAFLKRIEQADRAMIDTILSGDAEGFFRGIQEEQDQRNVCGVPALYTLLRVIDSADGRLLRYEQAADETTQSMVSFMAGAFYAPGA